MFKRLILLSILFISCSSYQTQYEEQVVTAHQDFFGLEFSTNPSDISSIIVKVKTECKYIQDEIDIHNEDNLSLEWVIDFHYITLRNTDKSDFEDSTGARERLEKTPEQVQEYMFMLYKYCNFEDVINDNWISLEKREEGFRNYS